ncbi:MAG: hypothetical protein FP816_19540 [Desulfobacteraceae bacterium]|nr:hypothetical protein [Desulfobacteraceae bacterium]MBU4054529.1 site-specific integrase [Pseudomonadota bacterium]
MLGSIYSKDKCPVCGSAFEHDERRQGLFCPEHRTIAASRRFIVKFGRNVRRQFQHYQAASRFLMGLRFETDKGSFDMRDYQADNPLGFAGLAEQFLEEKERTGMKSIGNIRNYMVRALEFFKDRNVKSIKKADIKEFLYMIKGISEKTRHNHASALHDFFFNFLVDDLEIITLSQAPKIPDIPYQLAYRNMVDMDTQAKIIEEVRAISYVDNPKIWLGIDILSLHTNIRPGDLLKIKEKDVDHKNGIITFWRPTKKKDKNKVIRIRLLDYHIDEISNMKAEFPGHPDMPFFRHTTKTRGVKADQAFGVHFFWKYWKQACTNLGIEGVDLYGGTRHSTTTWRAVEFGREKAKESSGHETNKAFDRYCQVDDFSFDIVKATAEKKGKVVPLKGGATVVPPKTNRG